MAMKPIANKYVDGKLKSTLERELKGRETVWKEADRASGSVYDSDCLARAGQSVADLCGPRPAGCEYGLGCISCTCALERMLLRWCLSSWLCRASAW